MVGTARCLLVVGVLCGVGEARTSLADGRPFVGHVAQGTVELVGVTYYRQTNQPRTWKRAQWWQADGTAAKIGPFHPRGTHDLRLFPDKKTLTFLFRVTLPPDGPPADGGTSSGATSSDKDVPAMSSREGESQYGGSTADASWPAWGIMPPVHWLRPTPMRAQGFEVADAHGDVRRGYSMLCVHFDAYTEAADLRASVSTSAQEWETVATWKPDSAGTSSFHRDGREWPVEHYQARSTPKASRAASAGSTRASLRLPSAEFYGRLSTRLVAVDKDGRDHASLIAYTGNDGSATFRGLPLSTIEEFQFQVRPCDWVEFRNVSLRPGQRTTVTVVSSLDSAEGEK